MNHEVSPSVMRSEILGSFTGAMRFLLFVVLIAAFVGCFSRAGATPPSRTVDVLSFTPPTGWETTQKGGSGRITMSDMNKAKDISCQITVYNSRQSSGDLAADFFSEWAAIVGSPAPGVGDISDEGARIVGVALAVPVSGENNYVRLITYSAGTKTASIVVLTPNLEAYKACRSKIDSFLASVKVIAAANGRPRIDAAQQEQRRIDAAQQAQRSVATPTRESSKKGSPIPDTNPIAGKASKSTPTASDNPVWVAEWNRFVKMSDLSGEWKNRERDGGTYWNHTLFFKGDGSFTSSFEARGDRTVSEKNQGTYTLSPRPTLRYAKGEGRPFNILYLEQLADGSSTMSILDSQYPINKTTRAMYETKFIRAAP